MHQDDQRIIRRFVVGEADAVREVETWIQAAAGSYRRRLGDDWQDAVQDALVEVTRLLREGRFEGRARLRTYVWRITNHLCIDRIRRSARWEWADIENLPLASRAASALDAMMSDEAGAIALRVVAEMSEHCRELWRRLLLGQSYRTMSAALGVAEGTLRVRVLRCRDRALAARARLLGHEGDGECNADHLQTPDQQGEGS